VGPPRLSWILGANPSARVALLQRELVSPGAGSRSQEMPEFAGETAEPKGHAAVRAPGIKEGGRRRNRRRFM